jgi:hypothetical protein
MSTSAFARSASRRGSSPPPAPPDGSALTALRCSREHHRSRRSVPMARPALVTPWRSLPVTTDREAPLQGAAIFLSYWPMTRPTGPTQLDPHTYAVQGGSFLNRSWSVRTQPSPATSLVAQAPIVKGTGVAVSDTIEGRHRGPRRTPGGPGTGLWPGARSGLAARQVQWWRVGLTNLFGPKTGDWLVRHGLEATWPNSLDVARSPPRTARSTGGLRDRYVAGGRVGQYRRVRSPNTPPQAR